ncbi:hypothetical protein D3C81_1793170 [compost metagenome]
MDAIISGITGALKNAESNGRAEFVIGNTVVTIDPRGISIVLNESNLDPVALRIHRPDTDASCWGYVLAHDPGKPKRAPADIALGAENFNVIGCL